MNGEGRLKMKQKRKIKSPPKGLVSKEKQKKIKKAVKKLLKNESMNMFK